MVRRGEEGGEENASAARAKRERADGEILAE